MLERIKIVDSARFLSTIGSFGTGCEVLNLSLHTGGETLKIVISAHFMTSLSGFVAIALYLRQVFLRSFTSEREAKYRVPQQGPRPIHAGIRVVP